MYIDFDFASRLTDLRQKKGVSARDMSLTIGQNETYINKIENRKALPSMDCFYYICEFLEIMPDQFFDESDAAPMATNEIVEALRSLSKEDLHLLAAVVDRLRN